MMNVVGSNFANNSKSIETNLSLVALLSKQGSI